MPESMTNAPLTAHPLIKTYPDITVLLPTYNRADDLMWAICNFRTYTSYIGKIHFLIGDDSDNGHDYGPLDDDVTLIQGPRRGLGANLNNMLRYVAEKNPTSLLFQMDDDHILHHSLNLTIHAHALMTNDWLGWIRLMQVGSHFYTGQLLGKYWKVLWESSEVYITSNRPHLKKQSFHTMYGYYPENVRLGLTEEGFCHQCKQTGQHLARTGRKDILHVGIPLDMVSEYGWTHVGDSWQKKGF